MNFKRLTCEELAVLFGTDKTSLLKAVGHLIDNSPLDYRVLTTQERDEKILDILQFMDSGELSASGPHRHDDWETGWSENLNEFVMSGYDPSTLRPKYYKKNRPCRLNNQLVIGESSHFLYAISDIFRRWLFNTYFTDCSNIHEFGCGTGNNLLVLGELFPKASLFGYDWATASQRILALVRTHLGLNVHGQHFDFFQPNQNFQFGPEAGVLTFGALEQVSDQYGPFLESILASRPSICVHVEGIGELYDTTNLLDYLALKYHRSRNYLNGFLTSLRELAAHGDIEIIAEHRQHYGNLFDDPHSYIVWRPL